MNILWQNEHYPDVVKGGGGAVNTYYIVTALQRLGHNAVILARGPKDRGPFREQVNGTTVQRLSPPALPEKLWPVWPILEPRYVLGSVAEVAQTFDAFIGIDFSFALSVKKLYPNRPLIYRVEGSQKSHDTAVAAIPGLNGGPSPSGKRPYLERLLEFENDLMDRRAWWRCDALVVKSQFMQQELQTLYGVPAESVHVIPNGVDDLRYANARRTRETLERIGNPDGAKVVISFCGRLVRMKNVPHLLRGFSQMRLKERCLLALLGDGEQRVALEKEAYRLGIAAQVKFLGHVERVEEFLAASDISVLPSVYEPFGNALLEAMAAGLPCVALRPGGVRIRTASNEIIAEGQTGFLVEGGNPAALAEKLDLLVGDPDLRQAMGRRGQSLCRARYSWERCASQYVDLISRFTKFMRSSA